MLLVKVFHSLGGCSYIRAHCMLLDILPLPISTYNERVVCRGWKRAEESLCCMQWWSKMIRVNSVSSFQGKLKNENYVVWKFHINYVSLIFHGGLILGVFFVKTLPKLKWISLKNSICSLMTKTLEDDG